MTSQPVLICYFPFLQTAIAEGDAVLAAGAPPEQLYGARQGSSSVTGQVVAAAATQLSELVVACLSRPEKEVTDAALDYLM